MDFVKDEKGKRHWARLRNRLGKVEGVLRMGRKVRRCWWSSWDSEVRRVRGMSERYWMNFGKKSKGKRRWARLRKACQSGKGELYLKTGKK